MTSHVNLNAKENFYIDNLSKLFFSFFPEIDEEVFFVRMHMVTLFNCLSIQLILLLMETQKQISNGKKNTSMQYQMK